MPQQQSTKPGTSKNTVHKVPTTIGDQDEAEMEEKLMTLGVCAYIYAMSARNPWCLLGKHEVMVNQSMAMMLKLKLVVL